MKPYSNKIPFNKPLDFSCNLVECDGSFLSLGFNNKVAENLLAELCEVNRVLLTPSCTASLEMTALAVDIQPGDEVILPSFTFVTSASAFALRGAKLVFVDICSDTLNIDALQIEAAITPKTRAVIVVHYAGVSCEMDTIVAICKKYNILLIEDAAQALIASYKGKPLGSIGEFGCISFHHSKNIHSGGEGGALLVNDQKYTDVSEIIQEKGTDRSRFLRGEVDKYTWQRLSSSYVMSEVQAIVLLEQLRKARKVTEQRKKIWNVYHDSLFDLNSKGLLTVPSIPSYAEHNAHIYHIRTKTVKERQMLFNFMRGLNIEVTSHFVPLHLSPAGIRYGRFHGDDINTTKTANTIIRLPLYNSLPENEQDFIINAIRSFFLG